MDTIKATYLRIIGWVQCAGCELIHKESERKCKFNGVLRYSTCPKCGYAGYVFIYKSNIIKDDLRDGYDPKG